LPQLDQISRQFAALAHALPYLKPSGSKKKKKLIDKLIKLIRTPNGAKFFEAVGSHSQRDGAEAIPHVVSASENEPSTAHHELGKTLLSSL
jgi:hypothetical protein